MGRGQTQNLILDLGKELELVETDGQELILRFLPWLNDEYKLEINTEKFWWR